MYLQYAAPILLALAGTVSCAPAQPAPAAQDVTEIFVGKGRIKVINGTFFDEKIQEENILGCLNSAGRLTTDDCAVFTRGDGWYPNPLSTSAGECTYYNMKMPKNKDSHYGKDTYAFYCGEVADEDRANLGYINDPMGPKETFYTINGFARPYVCTGNIGCYFDVPAAPSKKNNNVPVWEYFWGSQQLDVPAGHRKIVWLWEPTSAEESK